MAFTSLSENPIQVQPLLKQEDVPAKFVRGSWNVTRLIPPRQEPHTVEQPAACWPDANWQTQVTANDLRDLVRLLRKHPAGLSVLEHTDAFRKRVLDPARLAAYREWRIITQTGAHIRLTPFGHELAMGLAPEAGLFRALLDQIAPYRATLEWMEEHLLERATDSEVMDYWLEQRGEALSEGARPALKAKAVSFFHLCQAADFGVVTLGKRGQPARLRVDQDELGNYLKRETHVPASARLLPAVTTNTEAMKRAGKPRVAISAGDRSPLVQQIQTALSLADIESEVLAREQAPGPCSNEETSRSWRRCAAGLIVVSSQDQTDETGKERVLMSVGAAAALYAGRVLLLWQQPHPIPANLANLRRCEFDGEGLTWEIGAALVQATKDLIR